MEHFSIRTLCNYSKSDAPYIQNFRLFWTRVFQLLYNVLANPLDLLTYYKELQILAFYYLLLYPVLFIKSMTYSLDIDFFSHSLVYEKQSS